MGTHDEKLDFLKQAVDRAIAMLQSTYEVIDQLRSDPIDPRPPYVPQELKARVLQDGTLELVWTRQDATGLPLRAHIEVDETGQDDGEQWTETAIVDDTGSWESPQKWQSDKPHIYRVRVERPSDGQWSGYSDVADPAPFVIEQSDSRKLLPPGSLLDGKTGLYAGQAGTYILTDPESGLDFKGAGPDTIIKVASGKTLAHRGATGVKLTDLTIDGGGSAGGEKGPDNAKAMLQPGTKWSFTRVTIKDGQGVNVGWDGTDGRMEDCLVLNGGSAGVGGKADRLYMEHVVCIGSNKTNKSMDGAGFGKFTRTNALLAVNCGAEDYTNCSIWGDIDNSNWVVINFMSKKARYANSSKDWSAAGPKIEISNDIAVGLEDKIKLCQDNGVVGSYGVRTVTLEELKTYNFIYKGCTSQDVLSYCFDCNETQWVLYDWCSGTTPTSPNNGGHLSPRDLERNDAAKKQRANTWRGRHVHVKNFKVLDGDTFLLVAGGAGNRMSMSKNDIQVTGAVKADGTPALVKRVRIDA